nr:PREDICTED: interactor protein for cytohesin exchange factors 1 isoform X2 [Latimeria chalumnae]|eukprot:XP_014346458.1 PREDICTED: interactor protein for cytohesin exchange factors 1 isoform X2 [Latimeria chalumnae]
MSRRRISCKDLGHADLQGWLFKKKEIKGFIGNKWKKFWFVLKGSSLYWYTNQVAEKAEGFISLPDFKVDQATECKKKHAIKASHPQTKTFYFAAENSEEMNKWLNKLGLAAIQYVVPEKNDTECWSESEQDDPEVTADTPPPPYSIQTSATSDQTLQESSYSSPLSSEASSSVSSPDSSIRSQSSSTSSVKLVYKERQSWLDIVNSSDHGESLDAQNCTEVSLPDRMDNTKPFLTVSSYGSQESVSKNDVDQSTRGSQHLGVQEESSLAGTLKGLPLGNTDEMEQLYKSLEQASLSPIGDRRPSTRKELRKSFIKRCKNPAVNDKLHRIRTLNSTLKAKEADLTIINQLLEDPHLTAVKFREWKDVQAILFQEICQQYSHQHISEDSTTALERQSPPCIETDV